MVLSAYQILTVLQDNRFLNHTRREFAWKFDSFGIRQVLKWMFTGKLLDFGRPPVLSLLALAGTALLVAALVRWRRLRPGRELVLGGAVLWTMLYFGRPFWGKSLLLFGITSDIHLHRFIGGLHVFLVLLAGIALGTLWWEGERRRVASAVTIAVTLAMLYPMVRERVEYIQYSASEAREAEAELDNRRPALQRIAELVHERGGRVYDRPLSLVPADLFARRAPARGRDHVKAAYEGLPFYVYAASLGVPVVPESFDSLPLTAEVVTDFAEGDANHYRLFGVTTLVEPVRTAAPPIPFLGNAEIAGDFRVYQAPPTGYFELVNVAATRPVTRNTFPIANDAWLASDWPSRRTHLRLVLDGSAPEAIVILPPFPGTPPAGEILEQGPQAVRFRAAQDCTMLFKMTWHPNWRAYLDGKSTEVIMLSSGMMGAAAPKGEHRIDWRYEGSSYRPLLAALGVLLTAGAAWWEKKKRAGSKPTQSSAIGI
jgi:hypothetical protein